MLLALAYVSKADVPRTFQLLKEEAPEDLGNVVYYFKEYYVIGRKASNRGRVKEVPPRYPLSFWNVYEATRMDQQRRLA